MLQSEELVEVFHVVGGDLANAGRASTTIKEVLKRLGIDSSLVRRVAIAAYEAEMNIVFYAYQGVMTLRVTPERIVVEAEDQGPGITDIELAMQEGYSTATPEMREMGFGAGMGLPNIRKNSDSFEIASEVGRGTRLRIEVYQRR